MKVTLYQMKIAWEDKETNYIRMEKTLKDASERGTDLFLLPEMSFTGFSMNIGITKESDGRTMEKMAGLARKYHTSIGFGWVKDCKEKAENHYTVVDKEGVILSDYVKIHPFSYSGEDRWFRGGEDIVFFLLDEIIFSCFICYDLRFPEIFRAASKYAGAILVSANWPESRSMHWKCLLRARAIENQVYIIAVNCTGEMNGVYYSGDSCMIGPDGKVLCQLSNQEGILEYELRNDVWEVRDKFPVRADCREELYHDLMLRKYAL